MVQFLFLLLLVFGLSYSNIIIILKNVIIENHNFCSCAVVVAVAVILYF